jgi:peroxiredoxin
MRKYLPMMMIALLLVITIPTLRYFRVEGLSPGRRAPEFVLKDLNGQPVSLSALRGQVVMLNFWSPICRACREEMPEMQRVYDDLKDDGFTILAVNAYHGLDVARQFIEENGFTFTVVQDDATVARMYQVTLLPKTMIIDREGIIRQVWVGSINEEQLRRLVLEWL